MYSDVSMGNAPSFVAACLGIDASTVYRYRSAYLHGGTDELLENRYKGYWGLLDNRQLSALRKELREHIYTDAKSVAEWIKSTFGVEYSPQGVVDLLNRLGFTYKKTSEVPQKESYQYRILQDERKIQASRQEFLRQYRGL